ncbi:hypothetical protein AC578_4772 [Pseudocercospora eumusae]|uniref:Amidohydrolase-related domain-containing protein n=1 Tax=Pseudocercospora eumusae TaxID=321146 RepID=A0A139HLF6_9PEZI|nr:hypothetical protein AC578_4772 [Pseudocercospora eumusae]KXT03271.1 hypothetical protein AC578_4772 [Pseudocercospora eumusae]
METSSIRIAEMKQEAYDLVIANGIVVNANDTKHADVAIKGGTIVATRAPGGFKDATTTRTINAEGGWVMPGGIDAHIHLQEPQLFGKCSSADTFETGTRSAICGGTTTIIAFAPQSKAQNSLLSVLEATHAKAKGTCYCDYSFHLLISNPTEQVLAEFPALRSAGISSLKIYMTYEALQLSDIQILDVLLEARKQKITTLIHAENNDMIVWMTRQLEARKLFAPKYHATSHPALAEIEATYRAICLSEFIDVPILLVHVSSPASAANIKTAQDRGLPLYAETCPQYVILTKHDLDKPGFEGARCVCSPPPRESEMDHEGIWTGLQNGTFTILSSDHCPFLYENSETGKKTCVSEEFPNGRFKYIPNGIPGVETRLPLILSSGRLEVQKFVELTATNPAKLYGLFPKKGVIEVGSDADVVVWYPEGENGMRPFELGNQHLHHACDYTPYEGKVMKQWPRYTILRGKVVWDRDGEGLVGEKGYGQFLKRGKSCLKGSLSEEEWDIHGF